MLLAFPVVALNRPPQCVEVNASEAFFLRRQFNNILNAAKLPAMRIHDLRHSCASLLLEQGVHPRVVMETLGHSQISVTLDAYSHVRPALGADAAAKLNAAVMTSVRIGVKSGVKTA